MNAVSPRPPLTLRMRAEGAVIGGEGNGGVILPELHLGRDAPLGVALVLQMMHEDRESISSVVGRYPRYSIIKDKLDRPAQPLDAVYAALTAAFPDAEADTQDGLRLSWADRARDRRGADEGGRRGVGRGR